VGHGVSGAAAETALLLMGGSGGGGAGAAAETAPLLMGGSDGAGAGVAAETAPLLMGGSGGAGAGVAGEIGGSAAAGSGAGGSGGAGGWVATELPQTAQKRPPERRVAPQVVQNLGGFAMFNAPRDDCQSSGRAPAAPAGSLGAAEIHQPTFHRTGEVLVGAQVLFQGIGNGGGHRPRHGQGR
jgi:hypothetical protein